MKRAILLIDHGSRRSQANEQLEATARALEIHLAADAVVVEAAHMDIAAPSVGEGLRACIGRGATDIVVVPCMLSRGRHVTHDIPAMVREALEDYPDVEWRMAAPLCEQNGFIPLLAAAARDS